MKTGRELYEERLNRIKTVVGMQPADHPPIVFNASAFCVKYAGGKLSDLVNRIEYGNELVLKAMVELGVDSTEIAGDYPPMMGTIFLSPIKVPGRELPDDMIWQIDEQGLMSESDYDTIIDKGWNFFYQDFCKNRLNDVLKEVDYFLQYAGKIAQSFTDAGIVCLTPAMALPPFGGLSAGRGIPKFLRDLRRIPDKVQAAMDVIQKETVDGLRKQIREMKPLAVFIGGAREAGDFLSYKMFDRFAWPYFKELVEVTVEEGSIAYLHLDMCWDRFLDYFKELPRGKCIFSPDSTTDIFKAGEVLKGHMCFMGDVPPSMLTLGTPDEVYEYSMRLRKEFEPTGFIMAAGCSIPYNAMAENVKAMISAALD